MNDREYSVILSGTWNTQDIDSLIHQLKHLRLKHLMMKNWIRLIKHNTYSFELYKRREDFWCSIND